MSLLSRVSSSRCRPARGWVGAVLVLGALLVPAPGAAGDAGHARPAAAGDGAAATARAARCVHLVGVDPARTGCDALGPAATSVAAPAGPADCLGVVLDERCEAWRWDGSAAVGRMLIDVVGAPAGDAMHALVQTPTGLRLVTLDTDGHVLREAAVVLPLGTTAVRAVPSPDGQTVYVGFTGSPGGGVTAVAVADGASRWTASDPSTSVLDVALSGDGGAVVSAGYRVVDGRLQLRVVALETARGERRWAVDRPSHTGEVIPYTLAVDDDASRTVVVGEVFDAEEDRADAVALAFGDSGDLRWEHRLASPHGDYGWFGGVALEEETAYVTGTSPTGTGAYAGVVRALDLTDGDVRWSTSPEPGPYTYTEVASPVLSPDSGRIHVGGTTSVVGAPWLPLPVVASLPDQDALALGLDAASGRVLWSTRTGMPTHAAEGGYLLALSPDGTRLYQAGFSANRAFTTTGVLVSTTVGDVVTSAFDAVTGARLWTARTGDGDPSGMGFARGVVVLHGGDRVVTGAVMAVVRSGPAVSASRWRAAVLGYDR